MLEKERLNWEGGRGSEMVSVTLKALKFSDLFIYGSWEHTCTPDGPVLKMKEYSWRWQIGVMLPNLLGLGKELG